MFHLFSCKFWFANAFQEKMMKQMFHLCFTYLPPIFAPVLFFSMWFTNEIRKKKVFIYFSPVVHFFVFMYFSQILTFAHISPIFHFFNFIDFSTNIDKSMFSPIFTYFSPIFHLFFIYFSLIFLFSCMFRQILTTIWFHLFFTNFTPIFLVFFCFHVFFDKY